MTISVDDLKVFLNREFGLDGPEIQCDTLLFSEGLLDSLSVIELIAYIEKTAGITMERNEVTLDNLDSLDRIVAYVEEKVQAS